ncbi:hypothetical protein L1887_54470 [Cichorium endivia]|nr:hypothetical protein L1887_54470 [Cichorium endivia]
MFCAGRALQRARPGSRLRRPSCSRPSRYGIGSSSPTFRPPKWLEQCESDGTWTRVSAWGKAVDGETRVCPCAESVDCSGARWGPPYPLQSVAKGGDARHKCSELRHCESVDPLPERGAKCDGNMVQRIV